MTRTKKCKPGAKPRSQALIPCGVCSKSFRLANKLQRHLLEQHASKVSLSSHEDEFSNEPQRRAYVAAKRALDSANLYVSKLGEGSDVPCPRCRPDEAKGKTFKVAIDLASHIIEKHSPGLSDDDPAVSLISEAVATGTKRSVPEDSDDGEGSERVVKSSKLIGVDFTAATAVVPAAEFLPGPSVASGQAKEEPDVATSGPPASAAQKEVNGNGKRAGSDVSTVHDGLGKKRKSLALGDPEQPVAKRPSQTTTVDAASKPSVLLSREAPPPTARKPPTTPKRPAAAAASAPNGGSSAIAPRGGVQLATSPSPSAEDEPVETSPLKRKFVTRGYDLDFDDLADLKSCVDLKYYAARKAATAGDSR